MAPKVLFVLTNVPPKPDEDRLGGWYKPEAQHPCVRETVAPIY